MGLEDVDYYYTAIKMNEILPFVTALVNLKGIMLSETSHAEKEKYHMSSYIWNLKNQSTNITKQTYSFREQIGGFQMGGR